MKPAVIVLLTLQCVQNCMGLIKEEDLLAGLHETCIEETGMNEDLIAKVNTERKLIDDDKLKCYIKCLLYESGALSEDGLIDVDVMLDYTPNILKPAWEPVFRRCGTVAGSNLCETAWLTHACYLREARECLAKDEEKLAALHEACVQETGVSEDLINRVNTERKLFDDEKLKCYTKCLLTKTGTISDDGIIDVEAVLAHVREDVKPIWDPIIRKCGTVAGANLCETAWLTNVCYLKEAGDAYKLY